MSGRESAPWDDHTVVFICGLHRSGTTQLHATMATHPDVGAMLGTSAPHDEGQHLQDVFPTARQHGGPGRFAHDPRAHLTEHSPLASQESARRLWEQWSRIWPTDRRVLIEKSPPNLVRMRFLQALFPAARFLVIVRHPVTVSLATQKLATTFWMRRLGRTASVADALEHWSAAHCLLVEDLPSVACWELVRFEDLTRDPDDALGRVGRLAGLQPRFEPLRLNPRVDAAYAEKWVALRADLREERRLQLALMQARDVAARFGYDLDDISRLGPISI